MKRQIRIGFVSAAIMAVAVVGAFHQSKAEVIRLRCEPLLTAGTKGMMIISADNERNIVDIDLTITDKMMEIHKIYRYENDKYGKTLKKTRVKVFGNQAAEDYINDQAMKNALLLNQHVYFTGKNIEYGTSDHPSIIDMSRGGIYNQGKRTATCDYMR